MGEVGTPAPELLVKLKERYPKLARSLEVYYGDPGRDRAMDTLNGRFVKPGSLAFDIGSHVGDRVGSFRRLGAKVVALEPQPDCAAIIRDLYAGDEEVALEQAACGATPGLLTLQVNSDNPTVTTASRDFVAAAADAAGWEGQSWDREIEVPSLTLDGLIAKHGVPHFIKIDVEGFEDEVLKGLSSSIAALSFEFTTIERDVACRCLERLSALGSYVFDIALGESQQLRFGEGYELDAEQMARHVRELPHEANSGDIYAILGG
ncbi:MAG: FkbM family methyltransferase [Filomicrobium sp.]